MTPAKVIKFPAGTETPAPAKTSFTRLDNATDLAALYELPNALLKPALCLLEHRHMRPLHWGEVATIIRRGATQTREALSRLAELGHAVVEGDSWSWVGSTAARKAVRESARKPVRKSEFSPLQKTVWGGISLALKEVKEVKKEKNTNNTLLGTEWPAQFPAGVGAGAALASKTETARPVQDQTAHPQEGTINVTDKQKVAPAGAAPQTYRAAQDALTRAGAWDIWQTWVRGVPALGRNRAAQDAQIAQFAGWVDEGFADPLRDNVKNIVEAGTFAHPYNALKARMEKLKAVQHAEKEKVVELRRAFGDAQCQPGERRRAPDGRAWTVEAVEYGVVFFAEVGAPLDVTDREAAGWAVEA